MTLTSITLDATPAASSVLLSGLVVGEDDVAITPGAGWTELHETWIGFFNSAVQEDTNTTSTTVAWGTTSNPNGEYGIASWGIEIKADEGGGGGQAPARRMRLFEGMRLKLTEGRIILYQQ